MDAERNEAAAAVGGAAELKAAIWQDFQVASFFPSTATSGRCVLPSAPDPAPAKKSASNVGYLEMWLELVDEPALTELSRLYDVSAPAALSGPRRDTSGASSTSTRSVSDERLRLRCPDGGVVLLSRARRRHPGFLAAFDPPLRGSGGRIYVLFELAPHRLSALPLFLGGFEGNGAASARAVALPGRMPETETADLLLRFVFYQLLRALQFLLGRGLSLCRQAHPSEGCSGCNRRRNASVGNAREASPQGCFSSKSEVCSNDGFVGALSSRRLLLTASLWLQLPPPLLRQATAGRKAEIGAQTAGNHGAETATNAAVATAPAGAARPAATAALPAATATAAGAEGTFDRGSLQVPAPRLPPGEDAPLTVRWQKGHISNFEYLMALNSAAGREMSDGALHPVMPWVSDLTEEWGGWRDLTRTKYRLKKGDAQLDSTFASGRPPHHVPESLSELTYCIYMSRRLPVALLKKHVRSGFVAGHYPRSVARIYEWSPDECVPEYFSDASVFRSVHTARDGLGDLQVPPWCGTPEAFVAYHRKLLESDQVSQNLHRWIDLTFGCCLEGSAAVENKNVPLLTALTSPSPLLAGSGGGGSGSGGAETLYNIDVAESDNGANGFRSGLADSVVLEGSVTAGAVERRPPVPLTLPQRGGLSFVVLFRAPHPPRQSTSERHEAEAEKKDDDSNINVNFNPPTEKAEFRRHRSGSSLSEGLVAAPVAGAAVYEDHFVEVPHSRILRAAAAARESQRFADDASARLEPNNGSLCRCLAKTDSTLSKSGGGSGSNNGSSGSSSNGKTREEADAKLARSEAQERDLLQQMDLFGAGCLLAEMYASFPVVAQRDDVSEAAGCASTHLPLHMPVEIRAAILLLLRADSKARPSAAALVSSVWRPPQSVSSAFCGDGTDGIREVGQPQPGASVQTEPARARSAGAAAAVGAKAQEAALAANLTAGPAAAAGATTAAEPATKAQEAAAALPPLFPACFAGVYDAIAGMEAALSARERLAFAVAALPPLACELPLAAFSFLLPHVVSLLGLESYAGCDPCGVDSSASAGSSSGGSGSSSSMADEVAAGLTQLVDCVGRKLGPDGTCRYLLPALTAGMQKLGDPVLVRAVLQSPLLASLAETAGTAPFLTTVIPLVLRWLSSGVEEAPDTDRTSPFTFASDGSSGGAGGPESEGNVLQASGVAVDGDHWQISDQNLKVKEAAAAALSTTVFDSLGAGLGARYLLPALMDEFVYLFSASGTTLVAPSRAAGAPLQASDGTIEPFAEREERLRRDWNAVVAAVATATERISDDEATVLLVLERLRSEAIEPMLKQLRSQQQRSQTKCSWSCRGGVRGVLLLLRALLPTLPPWAVELYYLSAANAPEGRENALPDREETMKGSLPQLLIALAQVLESSAETSTSCEGAHACALAVDSDSLLLDGANLLVAAAACGDPAAAGRALFPVAEAALLRLELSLRANYIFLPGEESGLTSTSNNTGELGEALKAEAAEGIRKDYASAIRLARAVYFPLAATWGLAAAAAALPASCARLLPLLGDDLVPVESETADAGTVNALLAAEAMAREPRSTINQQENVKETASAAQQGEAKIHALLRNNNSSGSGGAAAVEILSAASAGPPWPPPPPPLPAPSSPVPGILRRLSTVLLRREASKTADHSSGRANNGLTGDGAKASSSGSSLREQTYYPDPLLSEFWSGAAEASPDAAARRASLQARQAVTSAPADFDAPRQAFESSFGALSTPRSGYDPHVTPNASSTTSGAVPRQRRQKREEWLDLLGAVGGGAVTLPSPDSSRNNTPTQSPSFGPLSSKFTQNASNTLPNTSLLEKSLPVDSSGRLSRRTWLLGQRLPAWEEVSSSAVGAADRGAAAAAFAGSGGGGVRRYETLGEPWTMKMCLQASFPAQPGYAVTSMCFGPGRQESLVLSGTTAGEVSVWDVTGAEPTCAAVYRGHKSSVSSVSLFCNGSFAASLGRSVHVWDVRRAAPVAKILSSADRLSSSNPTSSPFVAFQLLDPGAGVMDTSLRAPGFGANRFNPLTNGNGPTNSGGSSGNGLYAGWDQQIIVASSSAIYQYDLRAKSLSDAENNVVSPIPVAFWPLNTALKALGEAPAAAAAAAYAHTAGAASNSNGEFAGGSGGGGGSSGRSSYEVIRCLVACSGAWGDWAAVGTSGGQIAVVDRRNGRLVWLWRAHDGGIVRLFVTGRSHLLSIGVDRKAISWDLARSGAASRHQDRSSQQPYGSAVPIPLQAAVLKGLPDRGGGVLPAAAVVQPLNPGGSGETLLFTISRHKILAAVAPQAGEEAASAAAAARKEVRPCSFLGPDLRRVRRYHGLDVTSAAMLPLRRMLLLGCDDGFIRACL